MNIHYNLEDDLRLKTLGNELKGLLIERCPSDQWEEVQFAYTIAQEALGFLPMDDGPNKMSDQAIKAGIPKVEAMLALLRTLDAHKAHH